MRSVDILPLKGLPNLYFGASSETALTVLGKPDNEQILQEEIFNQKHRVWFYQSLDLRLYFDLQANDTLSSFECALPDTTLLNQPVFNFNEKDFCKFMLQLGYPLSETEPGFGGEKILIFESAALDAYFENNRLILLHCSAL